MRERTKILVALIVVLLTIVFVVTFSSGSLFLWAVTAPVWVCLSVVIFMVLGALIEQIISNYF